MVFTYSILSVLIISLISFIGVLLLILKDKVLAKILILMVSFSAGSLMGGAFFHILPESIESNSSALNVFLFTIIGFCFFFVLERIFRWRHCHKNDCHTHRHLGWMNLIGDGIHNLIDGMVIFSSFSVSPAIGLAVSVAIFFHEAPQEIGDFGVLIYSGFKKSRAVFYNFASALIAFFGVFLGYLVFYSNIMIEGFILPFAAGGFVYIAASDLIPELHREEKISKSIASFAFFIFALVFMWFIKIFFE